ncbi:MAG TPA: hypothetical protein VIS72_09030 [Anaerolineales bacterium]
MKRILVLVLVIVTIGACLPVSANPVPQVDTQATINAIVQTSAARTIAAQPSPTTAPPTETGTPVVAPSHTPTTDITETPSSSPAPNLTTTPGTATPGPGDNPTITSTMTGTSGIITLTPTLGILTYGTLPPAVPSSQVTLINKSKSQAYISLQLGDTVAKGAIIEYPVQGTVKIKAPLGNYVYVVWVGGRQFTGTLKVNKNEELTIIIFKDKVEIR